MKTISLKNLKWWQIALITFTVVAIGGLRKLKAGADPGEQPMLE